MFRATKKKVDIFNLARPEQKDLYEDLLNDPEVAHIIKEEFTYSKRSEFPIITVWYEKYEK